MPPYTRSVRLVSVLLDMLESALKRDVESFSGDDPAEDNEATTLGAAIIVSKKSCIYLKLNYECAIVPIQIAISFLDYLQ